MTRQTIALISFGHFGKSFLDKIAEAVKQEFFYPVVIKESHLDLAEFFDPGRRQYNGYKLLKAADTISNPDYLKTIGLFSVDLFIPILTYIFGQAVLNGRIGIASLYRLRNELYGMEKDDNLLLERFAKVVTHELGHAFGLIHCTMPTCVMRPGTYVEDIDQKKPNLCTTCRTKIGMV